MTFSSLFFYRTVFFPGGGNTRVPTYMFIFRHLSCITHPLLVFLVKKILFLHRKLQLSGWNVKITALRAVTGKGEIKTWNTGSKPEKFTSF